MLLAHNEATYKLSLRSVRQARLLRRNEFQIMKKNIFTNAHTFELRDALLIMTYK
jgi:hypothetical protein